MAVVDPDGSVRIVGRKATDLIKSGGYKIGAGEIENALLEHPSVREAAVTGEPDEDLGERIVAWIVPADPEDPPAAEALADHVARRLAPHKRPRTVRFLTSLPRNDMGKILKRALPDAVAKALSMTERFSAREAIALAGDDFRELPVPMREFKPDGPCPGRGTTTRAAAPSPVPARTSPSSAAPRSSAPPAPY